MFNCIQKIPLLPGMKKKTKQKQKQNKTNNKNKLQIFQFLQTLKKLCIIKLQQSKYNQRDACFLCIVALCLFPIFSLGKVLQWLFQIGFFHLGDKKSGCWSCQTGDRPMQQRLYRNLLGRIQYRSSFTNGHLTEVVVLTGLTVS